MADAFVQRVQGMVAQMEALGALGALLQGRAGMTAIHPDLVGPLERVAAELGVSGELAELPVEDAARLASVIRAFMTMTAGMLKDPSAPPGWTVDDPAILVSLGRASAPFANYFRRRGSPALVAAMDSPGARFLDIGVGIGALAMAICREFPNCHVTGIDPWEPSLRLARQGAIEAGLAERVTLLQETTETFVPAKSLDVAWIPGPFLPPTLIESTAHRLRSQLRPGGFVILGLFTGPGGLVDAVGALRAVRSGGGPIVPADGEAILRGAGFEDIQSLGADPAIQGVAISARNP